MPRPEPLRVPALARAMSTVGVLEAPWVPLRKNLRGGAESPPRCSMFRATRGRQTRLRCLLYRARKLARGRGILPRCSTFAMRGRLPRLHCRSYF